MGNALVGLRGHRADDAQSAQLSAAAIASCAMTWPSEMRPPASAGERAVVPFDGVGNSIWRVAARIRKFKHAVARLALVLRMLQESYLADVCGRCLLPFLAWACMRFVR